MHTRLSKRLALDCPIVQAPMAGTSTPELAAAVSNAGALGSIAVGHVDADTARRDIRATRALTSRPFNVNVFCHVPAAQDEAMERAWIETLGPVFQSFGAAPPSRLMEIYQSFQTDDAKLQVLIEERPAVVSFHFGLPAEDRIGALKQAGVMLFATATSPEEGRAAQDAGVDIVVAQGWEAGGHRGVFDPADDQRYGALALTRLLAARLDLPVVAAGGIMDGAGIAAVLALGAAGAQLGTAFVACPESAAEPAYRAALLGEPAERTRVSAAISGRPARGVENAFMRLADETAAPAYPRAYDLGKALNAAAKRRGDQGYGAWWAGQGAAMSRPAPAGELVRRMMRETERALADLGEIRASR